MLGRRLEYQSLKAVLLHTDANIRLQIRLHMPSIRQVEKVVPLKVKDLSLRDKTFAINNTEYQLELIRHYPNRYSPQSVKKRNDKDGINLNLFGFMGKLNNNVLRPRDRSFISKTRVEVRKKTEEDERRYNSKIFTFYIQLTIKNRRCEEIRRFHFYSNIFEARKHLSKVLLGCSTLPIRVANLTLNDFEAICFPFDFQLQVNNVRVCHKTMIHMHFPLVVKSFDTLWIHIACLHPNAYQCDSVQNAKRLVITADIENTLQELTEVLRQLPNRDICALSLTSYWVGRAESYLAMFQAWLSGDRQIGASLCMIMKDEEVARKVFELIASQHEKFESSEKEQHKVIVRQNNFAGFEISCVPFLETTFEERLYEIKKWAVKIKIFKV